jgi:hypothetical protein
MAAAIAMVTPAFLSLAAAQVPPAPAPTGTAPRYYKPTFSSMDANKDGSVSKDEYAAYRNKKFERLDTNKDGSISKAEYLTPPRGGHPSEHGQIAREIRFKQINTSGSGSISKAEWDAETNARFAQLDRNGDGKLTPDELGPPGRKGGAQ